ncbi:MAG: sugar kinase [Anaerolineae bacterium]|nr:sugar kinase [Anaerolineae bacterium]
MRARVRVVTFGEIMLRLSPPGQLRFAQARSFDALYGGGEANVAVSLAMLGLDAAFVSRVPDHPIGEACIQSLRRYGVDTRAILRGGDRLGIYFLEHGAAQRGSYVIYDRAGSAFSQIRPGMVNWDAIFQGVDWFHWTGITPAVSESAAKTCLEGLQAAYRSKSAGLTISCDLNYRAKLWKWGQPAGQVMSELVDLCDVVIGNEEDAARIFGIHAPGADVTSGRLEACQYREVCAALATRFPNLKTGAIAITLRGSRSASHNTWSAVLWKAGELFTAPAYDMLPIVDRVGGGDSFAAGLIYGLTQFSADPQRALNFAVAASALKHTIFGDFNLVTAEEVEKLAEGDRSGRVSR